MRTGDKRLTEKELIKIKKLAEKGLSSSEIGRKVGRDYTTISRYRGESTFRAPLKKQPYQLKKKQPYQYASTKKTGLPYREIMTKQSKIFIERNNIGKIIKIINKN